MINKLRNSLAFCLVSIVKIIAGRGFIIAAAADVDTNNWATIRAKNARQELVRALIDLLEDAI